MENAPVPNRPVVQTLVFADLAGYSALTEAHGDEHAADVAAEFCVTVRALLGDYGGEEVNTIGDALLIRVPDADKAIHLAARVLGESGARHRSLAVRVGMHTGTAVRRNGDWFGTGVNIAARVADAAGPGQALMTAATRRAAGAALPDAQIHWRGTRSLRNIPDPVEIAALALDDPGAARLPIDPVCRMAIDPEQSDERAIHGGAEYHFCSIACRKAFAAHPERYVR